MKLALVLIVSLLCVPAFGQDQGESALLLTSGGVTANWSRLQSPAQSCGAGSTCGLNSTGGLAVTTANSVGMVVIYTPDNNPISSMSLTGCSSGAGTWTGGSGAGYAVYSSAEGGMAWAFNLGNSGGCTGVSVTLTSAEAGAWTFTFLEFSRGGGTPALDALTSTNTNITSCTSCTGSSFSSLSGTKDLLFQPANTGTSAGSPSSPYVWDTNQLAAYALNSVQLTAPTWSQSGGPFQTLGAAFK